MYFGRMGVGGERGGRGGRIGRYTFHIVKEKNLLGVRQTGKNSTDNKKNGRKEEIVWSDKERGGGQNSKGKKNPTYLCRQAKKRNKRIPPMKSSGGEKRRSVLFYCEWGKPGKKQDQQPEHWIRVTEALRGRHGRK